MARKLRLLFPGARYHVLNRGNYRRDLFASPGAVRSFLATLDEACRRQGWRIHAYVVMRTKAGRTTKGTKQTKTGGHGRGPRKTRKDTDNGPSREPLIQA